MTRMLLTFVVGALFALAPVQRASGASAAELLSACEGFEGIQSYGDVIRLPADSETARCYGYFEAFQDLSRYASDPNDLRGSAWLNICAPERSRLHQYVLIFIDYARSHPARLHEDASVIALQALLEVWRCNQ